MYHNDRRSKTSFLYNKTARLPLRANKRRCKDSNISRTHHIFSQNICCIHCLHLNYIVSHDNALRLFPTINTHFLLKNVCQGYLVGGAKNAPNFHIKTYNLSFASTYFNKSLENTLIYRLLETVCFDICLYLSST